MELTLHCQWAMRRGNREQGWSVQVVGNINSTSNLKANKSQSRSGLTSGLPSDKSDETTRSSWRPGPTCKARRSDCSNCART